MEDFSKWLNTVEDTRPVMYRVDDVQYAPPVDEFDNPVGVGRMVLRMSTYRVEKVTPKGVHIDTGQFILRSATKQFALPTKQEAMASFMKRKQAQIRILSNQLQRAERALSMALLETGLGDA